MKGLLANDLLIIKKYSKQYLFMVLFFAVLSFATNTVLFLYAMLYMLCSAIILGQYVMDNTTGWHLYCSSIPILRKDYIRAKYLLFAGFAIIVFLISILMFPIENMFMSINFADFVYLNIKLFSYAAIVFSVSMPVMIKLNFQIARFVTAASSGLIAGGSTPFIMAAKYSAQKSSVSFILLFVMLMIFIVSVKISQSIYEKKEF